MGEICKMVTRLIQAETQGILVMFQTIYKTLVSTRGLYAKPTPAQNPQHNEPRLRTKNKNVCNMHDCLPQNVTLRGPSWPIHHNWSLECLQRRLWAGIHERSWSCKLPHNLRMLAPEPTRLCRGHQPVCVAGFQCFS